MFAYIQQKSVGLGPRVCGGLPTPDPEPRPVRPLRARALAVRAVPAQTSPARGARGPASVRRVTLTDRAPATSVSSFLFF